MVAFASYITRFPPAGVKLNSHFGPAHAKLTSSETRKYLQGYWRIAWTKIGYCDNETEFGLTQNMVPAD